MLDRVVLPLTSLFHDLSIVGASLVFYGFHYDALAVLAIVAEVPNIV